MKESEAFRVLGSADRQLLLHELVRTDGETTERDLARRVAARRHRLPPETVSEEQVERAHIRLIHVHLPLLDELNIVERAEGTVTLTDGQRRDRLLDAAAELDDWPPEDLLQRPPS